MGRMLHPTFPGREPRTHSAAAPGSGAAQRGASSLVLLSALIVTALLWQLTTRQITAEERQAFDENVTMVQNGLDHRLDAYTNGMLGARGLFAANGHVTDEMWHAYVVGSDLGTRYPGIRAFAYAPRTERPDTWRGVGTLGIQVRDAQAEDSTVFSPQYVESFNGSLPQVARHDLYTEPIFRAAMVQAWDSGLPSASERVNLADSGEAGEQYGFLIFLPVYRQGGPLGTVPERHQALQGFVVSVFDSSELLDGIFGESRQAHPGIDFEIFDGPQLTPEHLLDDEDHVMHAGSPSYTPQFARVVTIDVEGRTWSLYFSTLPAFTDRFATRIPLIVLAIGIGTSLALFGVSWTRATSRMLAEQRRLGGALREVQETERSRIADDLHDVVLQDLAYALQVIPAATQSPAGGRGDERLTSGLDALGRAVQGLRSAIYDLRPAETTHQPFLQSLETLVDLHRSMAPQCEFRLVVPDSRDMPLPPAAQMEFLRIVQEALTNARRHAAASRVRIMLGQQDGTLWAEVADDGRGVSATALRCGIGLLSMRRRARALGGEVDMQSTLGQGTRVFVRIPLRSPVSSTAAA